MHKNALFLLKNTAKIAQRRGLRPRIPNGLRQLLGALPPETATFSPLRIPGYAAGVHNILVFTVF